MKQIIVATEGFYTNPGLKELVQAIKELNSGYRVKIHYPLPRHGSFEPSFETIVIWIPWAAIGTAIAKKIFDISVDLIKQKILQYKQDQHKKRGRGMPSRYVYIYGPDGKVVKAVEVLDELGALEEITERLKERKPPN